MSRYNGCWSERNPPPPSPPPLERLIEPRPGRSLIADASESKRPLALLSERDLGKLQEQVGGLTVRVCDLEENLAEQLGARKRRQLGDGAEQLEFPQL